MVIVIKNNTIINNSGAGISAPPNANLEIEGNFIGGNKGVAIEIRDLNNLIKKTVIEIEKSNLPFKEKQNIVTKLINLIRQLPKLTPQLLKDLTLVVEVLANSPQAYHTAKTLIGYITSHF